MFELAAVRRNERGGEEVLWILALVAAVQQTELARAVRMLSSYIEATRPKLDERQVPKRLRDDALVPLAPLRHELFEERACALEVGRPRQDVRKTETGIDHRLSKRNRPRESVRPLGELERVLLARREAK